MKPHRRALIGVLLGSAVLSAGCARKAPATAGKGDPVPVSVGVVTRKDVPIVISEIGSVEPYSTVAVKAQIGGELLEVGFREGQDVRVGQVLFRIDPRPYEAALKSARAQLDKDTVQLKTARADVERYRDLVKKDYITQEEFDRISTNAAALEAAVGADQAAVENATVQLEYCTIRSPLDGRTGKLMVNQGNIVKANADTPMVIINQTDPIYVSFSVPERDLAEIKERRTAGRLEVRATTPNNDSLPLTGWLSFVDNTVNSTTGTVLLKGTFPNHDRVLWPGQFVNAILQVSTKPNALLVPTQAIQTGQQGSFLYVVKPDQTVESRVVTPGPALGKETVVENGVQEGERIVKDGQLRLIPGARITIQGGTAGSGEAPGGSPATPPSATGSRS